MHGCTGVALCMCDAQQLRTKRGVGCSTNVYGTVRTSVLTTAAWRLAVLQRRHERSSLALLTSHMALRSQREVWHVWLQRTRERQSQITRAQRTHERLLLVRVYRTWRARWAQVQSHVHLAEQWHEARHGAQSHVWRAAWTVWRLRTRQAQAWHAWEQAHAQRRLRGAWQAWRDAWIEWHLRSEVRLRVYSPVAGMVHVGCTADVYASCLLGAMARTRARPSTAAAYAPSSSDTRMGPLACAVADGAAPIPCTRLSLRYAGPRCVGGMAHGSATTTSTADFGVRIHATLTTDAWDARCIGVVGQGTMYLTVRFLLGFELL